MADQLARALTTLATNGCCDVRDLADALLLAAARAAQDAPRPQDSPIADRRASSPGEESENTSRPHAAPPTTDPPAERHVFAYNPASSTAVPGTALSIGRATALPRAIEVGNALRSFRRRWPHGARRELDLDATIQDYARTGLFTPQLKAVPELWLDVILILDRSPSMAIWDDSMHALTRVLRTLNAFQAVQTWHLEWHDSTTRLRDHNNNLLPPQRAPHHGGRPGRRLLLLVSDFSAPGWHQPDPWQTLHSWGSVTPLALLNPLPRRLWRRSALNLPRARVIAPVPAAPGRALRYHHAPRLKEDPSGSDSRQAVPVLTLQPHSVEAWARALMRTDPAGCDAVVIPTTGRLPRTTSPPAGPSEAHADVRAEAFARTAPASAVRLATLASFLDSFTLPILLALREQAVPHATLGDVAEFLTAGLLTTQSHPGHDDQFTYYAKARSRLKRDLTEEDAWCTFQALNKHLMTHPWAPHGIATVLHADTAVSHLPVTLQPVARATASAMRLLGIEPPQQVQHSEPPDDTPEGAEFEDFFRRTYANLVDHLRELGASEASADIAQEAMLNALTRWETIDDPGEWVNQEAFRIWNRRRRSPQAHELPVAEFPDSPADDDPAERETTVQSAMAGLPSAQRKVMELFLQGYTDSEIAGLLDLTSRTVMSRRSAAMSRLRKEVRTSNTGLRARAERLSGAESVVEGPLTGYHHETYVMALPTEASAVGEPSRFILSQVRADALWFDLRCFADENQLLQALADRIQHIPTVAHIGQGSPTTARRYIEGATLGSLHPASSPVPKAYLDQLAVLFGQLAMITPDTLPVKRICSPQDRTKDGDSTGFLLRLIHFTEQQVINRHLDRFGALFHAIGVPTDDLRQLSRQVAGLTARPFCLLHGDLHRDNFIIDADRRLWTVDWKRAMFGDPLYDLATHLHLMNYPKAQLPKVTDLWHRTVEEVHPGCTRGWQADLPVYLNYKRAQSVYTDIIRAAIALTDSPSPADLHATALRIHSSLERAREALGLDFLPGVQEIVEAFAPPNN